MVRDRQLQEQTLEEEKQINLTADLISEVHHGKKSPFLPWSTINVLYCLGVLLMSFIALEYH